MSPLRWKLTLWAALAEIGASLGRFDVTLMESGQYDINWADNHYGPELAVEANRIVGGSVMIPVHWGLINLSPRSGTEPVERVRAEACARTRTSSPSPPASRPLTPQPLPHSNSGGHSWRGAPPPRRT